MSEIEVGDVQQGFDDVEKGWRWMCDGRLQLVEHSIEISRGRTLGIWKAIIAQEGFNAVHLCLYLQWTDRHGWKVDLHGRPLDISRSPSISNGDLLLPSSVDW